MLFKSSLNHRIIESLKHKMVWVEKDLKRHLVPTPLSWTSFQIKEAKFPHPVFKVHSFSSHSYHPPLDPTPLIPILLGHGTLDRWGILANAIFCTHPLQSRSRTSHCKGFVAGFLYLCPSVTFAACGSAHALEHQAKYATHTLLPR